ncbi:unnamed protein product [Linum tenue]|uniref:Aminotransferase-like plant mobile domain-containing protein n=1 Tax=Linum tenue TaxID=586396 RepID=A0AAV0R3K8_9ROSI|nr:unnamed protein product [Linum tenue]
MFRKIAIDEALILAFVERWQPDTNTFHLSFGEMTILLHDVQYLLQIPVEGRLMSWTSAQCDHPEVGLCALLGMNSDELSGRRPLDMLVRVRGTTRVVFLRRWRPDTCR